MDLQDFWQENKRWVLGVVAGLIVYWIGSGIVEAAFGGATAVRRVQTLSMALSRQEVFDRDALERARAENERLTAAAARVREHVGFEPDDEFLLTGKGDWDLYFPVVERAVRSRVLIRAQEQGVDLDERALTWPAPVGREEIESTLLDLCVLQHAAMRLLDASVEVRQRSPDTVGLQSIEVLQIQKRSSAGAPRRGRRPGEALLEDVLSEHRVKYAFRGDVATLQNWLARLQSEQPSIGLSPDLRVTPGDQVGDPVLVQGHLSAVLIRDFSVDGGPR